ncbi:MAG: GAF domain-containing protein [Anaerolineae bacterium]
MVRQGVLDSQLDTAGEGADDPGAYRRELAVLNLLISLTSGAVGLSAILSAALDAAAELLGLPMGAVLLWNPTRRTLQIAAQRTPPDMEHPVIAELTEARLPETLSGIVFRSGTAAFVADLDADPGYADTLIRRLGARAAAALPLESQGQTLGVLVVATSAARSFTAADRHLLQMVARQVAIAIQRALLYEDASRRAEQMRLLVEIGRRLNAILDLETLLRAVVAEVQSTLRCSLVALCLAVDNRLQVAAAAGRNGLLELNGEMPDAAPGALSLWVGEHQESLCVPDLSADPRFCDSRSRLSHTLQSGAAVPVRLGERLLGALEVGSERTAAFDALDIAFLDTLATQAAVAISNACLFAQSQQSAAQLRTLLDTTREINATLDLRQLLEVIARQARVLIDVDTCIIFLLNPSAKTLTPVVAQGPHTEEVLGLTLRLGEGISGHVAASGIGEIVNHSEADPRALIVPGTVAEPEALLSAPLIHKGQTIGVMTLSRYGDRGFQPADLELLTSFAGQAAIAVENARLYTESCQHARELERAHARLERAQNQLLQAEKLSAIGHLAAGMAHELNNPLTAIIGFAQLLEDSNLESAAQDDVRRILGAAARAQKIVANLLAYARQQRIAPQATDLGALVERIIKLHATELQAGGVSICLEVTPNLPEACLDPVQMEQLVLHLLRNAHRAASEAAGGTIVVRLSQPAPALVRLEVADNGVPLAPELIERIFEPFPSGIEVDGARGLELAACFGIARAHGGRILAEPGPDGGTQFAVELPLDAAGAAAAGLTAGERSLLIVTADNTLANSLLAVADDLGLRVGRVESAEAALAEIVVHRYDQVVCDVSLPGMGIARLYESIRANDPQLAQRFVVIGQPPRGLDHFTLSLPLVTAQVQRALSLPSTP